MLAESDEIYARNSGHESLLYQIPTKISTGRLYIKNYMPEYLLKHLNV